jgi:putative ABC transport system substrate-binding protein
VACCGSGGSNREEFGRIGVLETSSLALNASNINALLNGLKELGYIEGNNVIIEYRSADGHAERFPDLAAELLFGS